MVRRMVRLMVRLMVPPAQPAHLQVADRRILPRLRRQRLGQLGLELGDAGVVVDLRACMHACAHACVRACVRVCACVCACVQACVRAYACATSD